MMLSRNFLSHCYEKEKELQTLNDIQHKYLPALKNLYEIFLNKIKGIN